MRTLSRYRCDTHQYAGAEPGNQNVHLSFNGPGGAIVSQTVFTILPGSNWESIIIPIDSQVFIALMGGGNPRATLTGVNDFRIFSNPMPLNIGEEVMASVDINNIQAETITAVVDFMVFRWSAFPKSRQGYRPIRSSGLRRAGFAYTDQHVGAGFEATNIAPAVSA